MTAAPMPCRHPLLLPINPLLDLICSCCTECLKQKVMRSVKQQRSLAALYIMTALNIAWPDSLHQLSPLLLREMRRGLHQDRQEVPRVPGGVSDYAADLLNVMKPLASVPVPCCW